MSKAIFLLEYSMLNDARDAYNLLGLGVCTFEDSREQYDYYDIRALSLDISNFIGVENYFKYPMVIKVVPTPSQIEISNIGTPQLIGSQVLPIRLNATLKELRAGRVELVKSLAPQIPIVLQMIDKTASFIEEWINTSFNSEQILAISNFIKARIDAGLQTTVEEIDYTVEESTHNFPFITEEEWEIGIRQASYTIRDYGSNKTFLENGIAKQTAKQFELLLTFKDTKTVDMFDTMNELEYRLKAISEDRQAHLNRTVLENIDKIFPITNINMSAKQVRVPYMVSTEENGKTYTRLKTKTCYEVIVNSIDLGDHTEESYFELINKLQKEEYSKYPQLIDIDGITINYYGEDKKIVVDSQVVAVNYMYSYTSSDNTLYEDNDINSLIDKIRTDISKKENIDNPKDKIADTMEVQSSFLPSENNNYEFDEIPVVNVDKEYKSYIKPLTPIYEGEVGLSAEEIRRKFCIDDISIPLDNMYILIMSKSSIINAPKIEGIIRVQMDYSVLSETEEADEVEDSREVIDESDTGAIDASYTYQIVTAYDLLTEEVNLLSSLKVDAKVYLYTEKSKYNLFYPLSPRLDLIANNVNGSCYGVYVNNTCMNATYEDIEEALPTDMISLSYKKDMIYNIQRLFKNDSIAESFDNRIMPVTKAMQETINTDIRDLLEQYLEEQRDIYGNVWMNDKSYSASKIVPAQRKETDKLFLGIIPLSEAILTPIESPHDINAINLTEVMPGILTDCKYYNTIHLDKLLKFMKDLGHSQEELDATRVSVEGSYDSSLIKTQFNEIEFMRLLKNYVCTGLIVENEITTKEELLRLIENGAESNTANKVLKILCKLAYTLNHANTGLATDMAYANALGYRDQGLVNSGLFAYYDLKIIGEIGNKLITKDINAANAFVAETASLIDGYYGLEQFIDKYLVGPFKYAEALVKLLRWGPRKPLYLLFDKQIQPNQSIVYDFIHGIVDRYKDYSKIELDGTDLDMQSLIIGKFSNDSINNKARSSIFSEWVRLINPNYSEDTISSEVNRNIITPTFAKLMHINHDGERIEMYNVDMYTLIDNLYRNNGIQITQGEYTKIMTINGVSYNEELQRILVDDTDIEETLEESYKFKEDGDRVLINKLSEQASLTLNNSKMLTKKTGTKIISVSESRILDDQFKSDAHNANASLFKNELDISLLQPYEVFKNFVDTSRTNRRDLIGLALSLSGKYAMPNLIFDRLFAKLKKFTPKDTINPASLIEIKLNMMLYGYFYTKNMGETVVSIDEDEFIEAVVNKDAKLNWTKMPNRFKGDTTVRETSNFIEGKGINNMSKMIYQSLNHAEDLIINGKPTFMSYTISKDDTTLGDKSIKIFVSRLDGTLVGYFCPEDILVKTEKGMPLNSPVKPWDTIKMSLKKNNITKLGYYNIETFNVINAIL